MAIVREAAESFGNWFWNDDFWLPPNMTWEKYYSAADENTYFPHVRDLWVPLPVAIILLIIRILFERYIALPIGRYHNLSESPPRKAAPNPVLEKAFIKSGKKMHPGRAVVTGVSKQLDLSDRQVERWFRRRKYEDQPTEMKRFTETCWRFVFYFAAFWYGIIILFDKPWFWDTKHFWYSYPFQHVGETVFWYYMIELGFYCSLIMSLLTDVKRKDFKEMVVHHIVTIALLVLSWGDNFVRVGSMVLVVHDAVDYWMEGAKAAKYLRYHKTCDFMFIVFTLTWAFTRLGLFPFRILWSTMVESFDFLSNMQPYCAFNGLLLILLALDIMWFYIIVQMVYLYIVSGQVNKDERSESEPDSATDSDTDDDVNKMNGNVVNKRKVTGANGNNNIKSNGDVISNGTIRKGGE